MGIFSYLIKKLFKGSVNEINGKGLGALPSPEDERDYLLGEVSLDLPEEYMLYRTPIKSQGSDNSCTAMAISSAMETFYKEPNFQLSPKFNWYCSRSLYMNTFPKNTGVYLRDAIKSANKEGIPPESLCPYTEVNVKPTVFSSSFSRFFKVKSYYRLFSVAEAKYALTQNMPLIIGLRVWSKLKTLKTIKIDKPKISELSSGHALCVTGYNKDGFIVQNSWGKGFGLGGLFILPFEMFCEPYIFESWAICDTFKE